jgi:hypothetical protein
MIRRTVVLVLLAAWSFPAAAATKTQDEASASHAAEVAATQREIITASTGATPTAAQQYAARETQSKGLQDFQGGEGYIYIGGGVLTAVLLVLLILILV